ncbi:cytochrome P450 monooxygenase [Ophiocordyceps sinensis CO18]|uniref:Cytochrome P450 monooxygenase n=1 Tax=Ophiocordyceps sinensis (strain Co18 / CGMCC 3.14243) TaxID=911162 RepID=T5AHR0_OPHSC|nr:cytochrome P450 monooxygenase [Ophiocordyceps sinensis CO18]
MARPVAHGCPARAALVVLVYLFALPRPLPGIPYNKRSSRRLFGDVSEIRQSTYRRQWIWSQPSVHGAPISQAFLFPFRRPTVIVSDYRTAVDICSRRTREFDRGTRNRECVGLTAPNFHFSMQTSDPRLRRHRELLRDLMTPWFLREVAGPRIYDRAAVLVDLWSLKQSKVRARPFAAARDLSLATLDMISSAAFGMEKSKAALSKEMLRVQSFDIKGGPESSAVVEFPRATQDPEIEALLDMANMMAIAQGSPFPTLAQWLGLLKPRHARAHWHRRVLLRRQTEKSLQRLASTGDESVPESALGQLLRREKRAAAKMGRPPDFWSHAIRDEVLGYLLGGHETSATALAWFVKHMTRHQHVQERLRRVLFKAHSAAVADGRCPTMAEIVSASVPFLDATLEETLRCASLATLIVRRATCDTHILGYPIPEGTDVIIPLTGPSFTEPALVIPESLRSEACRNAKDRVPAWSDDIAEYRPERWLKHERDAAGKNVEIFDALAGPSLVFSCGPRNCFGKKQAYLQLRTTVTLLLWNFAFEPIDEALDGWEITESLVNLPKSCYVSLGKL